MRSNDLKERMLRQPSRFWLVLSIVLLLAGLGFLGAFGHAQYQYGKSGRYYARLQQTAADPDGGIDFAALQAITIHPAEHIGVADRVGSIQVGKDADLVLTDGSPFAIATTVRRVLIDGKTVYQA